MRWMNIAVGFGWSAFLLGTLSSQAHAWQLPAVHFTHASPATWDASGATWQGASTKVVSEHQSSGQFNEDYWSIRLMSDSIRTAKGHVGAKPMDWPDPIVVEIAIDSETDASLSDFGLYDNWAGAGGMPLPMTMGGNYLITLVQVPSQQGGLVRAANLHGRFPNEGDSSEGWERLHLRIVDLHTPSQDKGLQIGWNSRIQWLIEDIPSSAPQNSPPSGASADRYVHFQPATPATRPLASALPMWEDADVPIDCFRIELRDADIQLGGGHVGGNKDDLDATATVIFTVLGGAGAATLGSDYNWSDCGDGLPTPVIGVPGMYWINIPAGKERIQVGVELIDDPGNDPYEHITLQLDSVVTTGNQTAAIGWHRNVRWVIQDE